MTSTAADAASADGNSHSWIERPRLNPCAPNRDSARRISGWNTTTMATSPTLNTCFMMPAIRSILKARTTIQKTNMKKMAIMMLDASVPLNSIYNL